MGLSLFLVYRVTRCMEKKKNIGKKMFFITDMDGSAIIHLATLIQRFKSYWAYYQHCFSYRLRIHSQWHNPD